MKMCVPVYQSLLLRESQHETINFLWNNAGSDEPHRRPIVSVINEKHVSVLPPPPPPPIRNLNKTAVITTAGTVSR